VTEDEEAELLSFTGKTIDGKLYVDFEDFDRLRRFVSNYLEKMRQLKVRQQDELERMRKFTEQLRVSHPFLDSDICGGQV
jgi:fido (protein-threonine AMPylation protein)